MALKTLMLRKRIDEANKALENLRAKDAEFEKREAELETAIAEAETDEEKDTCENAVTEFEEEKTAHEENRASLQSKLAELEAELEEEERKNNSIEDDEEREVDPMPEKRDNIAEIERRALNAYVRGMEMRDDYNMIQGNNGAIVPTTIAAEIITKVKNICPIYDMAHKYNVKGKLEIPYYPASDSHVVAAAYKDEMAELEAASGDFGAIELTGYELGALAKISRKLINNTDVDIVPFVTDQLAEAFRAKFENELINGTSGKVTGALAGITQIVTAAHKSTVTSDDLINLQDSIPDALQQNACWIMKPATRTAIRKLKDNEGRYLLNADISSPFGYTLLGKPVYCSDVMPGLGTTGNKAIMYGDLSGLGLKETEELEIQLLMEKFATQHAVGVVGWAEIDAKVENAQKLAVLKCGASDPT